jgi:DNA end-binding protein Ku
MARTIWTGSLSFGLVNVPVGLYSATEDKSVRFNQFQAGTSDRVRNKRVNERTGDEVEYRDIVKGFDLGTGEHVIVTPDEIASVAPGKSRTIDVAAFVDLAEIDPVYFEKPYFLAPHGTGGDRAYALLLEAMTKMNKVAIATFVMRDREYLAAVRPYRGALVLETLLRADEVRDPVQEIDTLPVEAEFDRRELDMAKLLIDSMAAPWRPGDYVDTYRGRLMELIEQKRQGKAIVVEHEREVAAPVVDLLQALEASVSAARGSSPTGSTRSAARPAAKRGRAPAATAAPAAPAPAAKAGGAALGDLSKADLVRRAAELGIAGRTKMSRDELEKAVRSATGGRRRRAS